MTAFLITLGVFAAIEVALFVAGLNSVGQAVPLAPMLFWAGLVCGGILFGAWYAHLQGLKVRWAVFCIIAAFAVISLLITAYEAHQNYDDPENWINWGVFRIHAVCWAAALCLIAAFNRWVI